MTAADGRCQCGKTSETCRAPHCPAEQPIAGRLPILLAAIRRQGGRWTTVRVQGVYRALGTVQPLRATARHDLAALHRRGHLVLCDTGNDRHYTARTSA